ncbi:hypothetical protein DPV78_000725 [Talaromyces pinophilus]|nr:hypothetical protein DPV78_000725 [Talaromyces pinophilus]
MRGHAYPMQQGAKSASMQNPIPTETARGTVGPTAGQCVCVQRAMRETSASLGWRRTEEQV